MRATVLTFRADAMKLSVPTSSKVGEIIGRTISRKLCQPVPPETIAASSSSNPNCVNVLLIIWTPKVMLEIKVARINSDIEP